VPAPIAVELEQYDLAWAEIARHEAAQFTIEIGEVVITVHHFDSTAIPGIRAKVIFDLMSVVLCLVELETSRSAVERLGYSWWGEYQ
jgi:GrpB-like predicted nucleotidyltransferase (UPF0157 family)